MLEIKLLNAHFAYIDCIYSAADVNVDGMHTYTHDKAKKKGKITRVIFVFFLSLFPIQFIHFNITHSLSIFAN